MTKQEYDSLYNSIVLGQPELNNTNIWRFELVKVLWEIRDALKQGMDE